MLLGHQSLEHPNSRHIINLSSQTRNPNLVIPLLNLSSLGPLQSLIGIHPRVVCQDQRDLLKGRGKSLDSILLNRASIFSYFSKVQRTAQFAGPSSNYDIWIFYQISDHA